MHLFLQVRIFNASTPREVESSKMVGPRIKSMNLSGGRGEKLFFYSTPSSSENTKTIHNSPIYNEFEPQTAKVMRTLSR